MSAALEKVFLRSGPEAGSSRNRRGGTQQVKLENVENFNNTCRICASVTELVVPIFEGEGKENNLAEKIQRHLPVQVSADDKLPQAVCYQCLSTVLAWHELVACCVQADAALRTRLHVQQGQVSTSAASSDVNADSDAEPPEVLIKPGERAPTKTQTPEENTKITDTVSGDSDSDEPLALVAGRGAAADSYQRLYAALLRFRRHYLARHEASSSEDEPDELDELGAARAAGRRGAMSPGARRALEAARVHEAGRTYYACARCGKRLSSPHTLAYHARIHTGERPCVCDVCGARFRAPPGLRRHLAETHGRAPRRTCPQCPATFANSQNLKQHARIHSGERPHVCARCGRRFTQSGSLHAHQRTHTRALPYACALCPERFRLRAALVRHRRRHERAPPAPAPPLPPAPAALLYVYQDQQ